jgi:hypothetical protein
MKIERFMSKANGPDLSPVIGHLPYRCALAGGWIDQPFLSKLNPDKVGSMVVVAIHPTLRFYDRAGMATGTRKVMQKLWGSQLPEGSPEQIVRKLYAAENEGKGEPSGSQDMIGLVYPGISRLDYDASSEGGYFPRHIESCLEPDVAAWIERVLHIIPVAPRPPGYSPLGEKNLDAGVIRQLGQTGKDCYSAIVSKDIIKLGKSMSDCMHCWATLLPHVVKHPTLELDLAALLECYQCRYPGAMYSGCGGGYLYVVSEVAVPGAFKISVRLA